MLLVKAIINLNPICVFGILNKFHIHLLIETQQNQLKKIQKVKEKRFFVYFSLFSSLQSDHKL
jgi:hypothetical protein